MADEALRAIYEVVEGRSVTDARAANPKHAAVAKAYGLLRGKAKDHVTAALPRLGAALEQQMR